MERLVPIPLPVPFPVMLPLPVLVASLRLLLVLRVVCPVVPQFPGLQVWVAEVLVA